MNLEKTRKRLKEDTTVWVEVPIIITIIIIIIIIIIINVNQSRGTILYWNAVFLKQFS